MDDRAAVGAMNPRSFRRELAVYPPSISLAVQSPAQVAVSELLLRVADAMVIIDQRVVTVLRQ